MSDRAPMANTQDEDPDFIPDPPAPSLGNVAGGLQAPAIDDDPDFVPDAADHVPDDGMGNVALLQGVGRWGGGDLIRAGLNNLETYAQKKMIDAGIVTPDVARDYDAFQEKSDVLANKVNHPGKAALGEVVGVVGQAALTGGAGLLTPGGLISKGTTQLGKQVATGVAAKSGLITKGVELAAQGAAEGAIYGGVSELNDAYLAGDYDGLTEKMFAGAYTGAAIGAGAAPLVGGLFALAGKAAKGLLGRKIAAAAEASAGVVDDDVTQQTVQVAQRLDLDAAIEQNVAEVSRLSSEVDGELEAVLETSFAPVYMQRGALISSEIAEQEIGKAQKVFAQMRAAEGGFEEAQKKAVKEAGNAYSTLLLSDKRMDRFAGKAAKRRAAEMFDGIVQDASGLFDEGAAPALGSMAKRIDDLVADYGETALADQGGLAAVKGLRLRIANYGKKAQAAFARGDVGTGLMELDDLKSAVGRAHGSKNQVVKRFIEGEDGTNGLYSVLQNELQNVDRYGDWAVIQGRNNATWTEKIRRSMDQRITRFYLTKSGEQGATSWESAAVANKEGLDGFLNKVGDESLDDVEAAFRRHIRSVEIDARNRAASWGTPELKAEAEALSGLVDTIESNLNAVALSRKSKLQWDKATRNVGEIPYLGAASKTVLRLGQKVAGRATSETARKTTTRVGAHASVESQVASGATPASAAARKATLEGDKALTDAPPKFFQRIKSGAIERAAESGSVVDPKAVLDDAKQLSDPQSQQSQDLGAYLLEMSEDEPAMAQAIAAKTMARVQFLLEKAGPEQLNQFGQPVRRDPVSQAKLDRYAKAVVDPVSAIDRIASGHDTAEDTETVQTLYPALWGEFVTKTLKSFEGDDVSYDMKIAASLALGIPLDDSMSADRLAFTQSRLPSAEAAGAKAKASDMGAQVAPLTGDRIAYARG